MPGGQNNEVGVREETGGGLTVNFLEGTVYFVTTVICLCIISVSIELKLNRIISKLERGADSTTKETGQ